MSNPPLPPSQPRSLEQKPESRSNYKPAVVTLLSSVVLAGGSCYGFLLTLDMNGRIHAALNLFFLIVFCLCVMIFLGTIIWIIARAIRNSVSHKKDAQ